MHLGFTQLVAFKAVADARSISRAADTLLVSQPAVTKQVRQLERSLGVKLFDRHARGVSLTESGEVLASYARRIFNLLAEAEQAIDDLQGLRQGKLAIAASPTIGVYFLPDVLVHYRQRFPAIDVS